MKRIISFLLCLVMVVGFVPSYTLAASATMSLENELAEDLKALGLFRGVSENDFALSRAPTRIEALVMLIRILGKESQALSQGGAHPFLDVPQWADKYVGYAYQNNLTNGVSATKFGSSSVASASMYLTFVLRSLGYSDANGDFSWDNPYALARQVGIMGGNPDVINFLRGDVVLVSYAALEAEVKGTGKTLAEKLISAGKISAAAYDTYYQLGIFGSSGSGTSVQELTSEAVYKKCSPAVFYIEVYNENNQPLGHGSGFFISSDGTAVTNYHVIEGCYSAKIVCPENNRTYAVEGVYDYSINNDWAIIKIKGENFPYLQIDEAAVTGGAKVYAIGSPLGLQNTISEGLISNPERILDTTKYIQISAPISPGSSGGALINTAGKVIGITSAGFNEGQNLNLAIPISAIDGYSKSRAYPFSAIGEVKNTRYLGNLNLSGYTKSEAVFVLLKSWVGNYANATFDGRDIYYEEFETGSGIAELWLAYNDDQTITLTTMVSEKGSYAEGSVTFNERSNDAYCEFLYFFDENSRVADLGGYAYENKKFFYDGAIFTFDKFYGDYEYEYTCEDLMSTLTYMALMFGEQILTEYLSYYGDYSMADIGFENLNF